MPTNKDALLRYLCIDQRLRKKPSPSMEELQASVEKEMGNFNSKVVSVSRETLKKDIQTLRNDFGSPIDYDRMENIYFYQNEDYTFLNLGDNIINRLVSKIKMDKLELSSKTLESFIQFEEETSIKGWEYIPELTLAISSKKMIEFEYQSKSSKEPKTYLLNPLLLKENRNHWYLLVTFSDSTAIRTFNLSRIIGGITITEQEASCPPQFKPLEYFNNSIGVTAQQEDPVDIVLEFSPSQASYLKEMPLHKSQKILVDNKEEFRVNIFVEPTYEVMANILSYGENVVVLKPEKLRKDIVKRIKDQLDNYKVKI